MTCIVGLIVNDTLTFMGGDAAASAPGGWSQTIIADPKVFAIGDGEFLVGVAGQPRLAQLMEHAFVPPPYDEQEMSVTKYMVTTFVREMRRVVQAGGIEIPVGGQEGVGGHLLIAFRGRLFEVDSRYDIGKADAPFHAIGSGALAALGALHATRGLEMSPYERVLSALDAAERINTTVRGPFRILCQRPQSRLLEVVEYSYTVDECPRDNQHSSESDSGTSTQPAA